jgi:lysophospholipase L1-like esterase
MKRSIGAGLSVLGLLSAGLGSSVALAEPSIALPPPSITRTVSPDPAHRWDASLAAFALADQHHAPPPGGVVFVGSSSIRLWGDVASEFADQPVVINRGFGGSKLSDCVRYLDRLVIPYKPHLVVVYAGDNDLAEGSSPREVAEKFAAFVEGVHERLPETRIAFISIKPSPGRVALLNKVRAANALIRAYVEQHPAGLDFIDVFTPMLDANGNPRRELFKDDSLHLNDQGYALWRATLRPYVR